MPDGGYSSAPAQTTILGAAKLTGRIGNFSVGALNAVTSDEDAIIANGTVQTRQTIEPLTNYAVVRARREFANQSALGFMTTLTNRNLDDADTIPARRRLHRRRRRGLALRSEVRDPGVPRRQHVHGDARSDR